ncbi:MAG: bifunctional alpha/beta hydrolase/OsmC family protein [Rhodothermales bacterium]|nr:bifunctional alpha/beta hydrolase/OsmC family protein [Rhodothermales bacterium]
MPAPASRRLAIPTGRGHDLAARLDLPADGEPIASALFAHCFTCSKDLRAATAIARALTREGFAVLRIDFTGLGQSGGDFADSTFSTDVADLARAAEAMAEEAEAPSVLVGHSLGGAAVLQAAHRIPSAQAVATVGAPCDPAHVRHLFAGAVEEIEEEGGAEVELAGRQFTITRAFLDDLAGQRMQEAIRTLGRALLVFHSPVDDTVGIENARMIYEAAKHPKSFVSLDRADHLLTDRADAEYVGTVLAAWARRYVGAPQEERKALPLGQHRLAARVGAEGFRTEVVADGHALTADEPEAVGGTNRGPTPYDLVAAGLGACTAMTLRLYADRKGWPLEEAVVRLTHRTVHAEAAAACDGSEPKLDLLEREVELLGPLSAEQRQRLLQIANRCPVHRTLERGVRVETALREAVGREA